MSTAIAESPVQAARDALGATQVALRELEAEHKRVTTAYNQAARSGDDAMVGLRRERADLEERRGAAKIRLAHQELEVLKVQLLAHYAASNAKENGGEVEAALAEGRAAHAALQQAEIRRRNAIARMDMFRFETDRLTGEIRTAEERLQETITRQQIEV